MGARLDFLGTEPSRRALRARLDWLGQAVAVPLAAGHLYRGRWLVQGRPGDSGACVDDLPAHEAAFRAAFGLLGSLAALVPDPARASPSWPSAKMLVPGDVVSGLGCVLYGEFQVPAVGVPGGLPLDVLTSVPGLLIDFWDQTASPSGRSLVERKTTSGACPSGMAADAATGLCLPAATGGETNPFECGPCQTFDFDQRRCVRDDQPPAEGCPGSLVWDPTICLCVVSDARQPPVTSPASDTSAQPNLFWLVAGLGVLGLVIKAAA